ncbi:wiskott-Aldrich syndrome protein homolog [Colossoma macropomum]|uniref:wiskott-Aldrich syndrome protein homolog n=1 Tax=Colossoma macropomum TaxID=42526 RepID=UPI0018639FC3|nr:wiskott-Aldrich syndrome protein homolog [Colossoma macropomum]
MPPGAPRRSGSQPAPPPPPPPAPPPPPTPVPPTLPSRLHPSWSSSFPPRPGGGVKGIAGAQLARERAAPCRLPTSCPCACHSYPRERAEQVSGAENGAGQARSQKRKHTHTQLFSSSRNGVLVDCGGMRRSRWPFHSPQGLF